MTTGRCPRCSWQNATAARFCGGCGQELAGGGLDPGTGARPASDPPAGPGPQPSPSPPAGGVPPGSAAVQVLTQPATARSPLPGRLVGLGWVLTAVSVLGVGFVGPAPTSYRVEAIVLAVGNGLVGVAWWIWTRRGDDADSRYVGDARALRFLFWATVALAGEGIALAVSYHDQHQSTRVVLAVIGEPIGFAVAAAGWRLWRRAASVTSATSSPAVVDTWGPVAVVVGLACAGTASLLFVFIDIAGGSSWPGGLTDLFSTLAYTLFPLAWGCWAWNAVGLGATRTRPAMKVLAVSAVFLAANLLIGMLRVHGLNGVDHFTYVLDLVGELVAAVGWWAWSLAPSPGTRAVPV